MIISECTVNEVKDDYMRILSERVGFGLAGSSRFLERSSWDVSR